MRSRSARRSTSHPDCESLEDRRLLSTVLGLSGGNRLVYFQTDAPQNILANFKLKGLARRDALVGIDVRPATGDVYGFSLQGLTYRINVQNSTATPIGPPLAAPPTGLREGSFFGVDFDPVADELRIVNDLTVNLRIDPDTGAVVDSNPTTPGAQADSFLKYQIGDVNFGQTPRIAGLAYSNNIPPVSATTLFGIDSERDVLVRQGSPDGTPRSPILGELATIGSLFANTDGPAGMDIETIGGVDVAFAALSTGGPRAASEFVTIDLGSGTVTTVGEIGLPRPLTDITLLPRGNFAAVADSRNRLHLFDTLRPNVIFGEIPIIGLFRGEKVQAVDFDEGGRLFGLTSLARLLEIAGTGQVRVVSQIVEVEIDKKDAIAFDIDSALNMGRISTSGGQNFRVNLSSGEIVDEDEGTPGLQILPSLSYNPPDPNAGRAPQVRGLGSAGFTNAIGTADPDSDDRYTITLEAGQTIDVILDCSGVLMGRIRVFTPGGTLLASDVAPSAGGVAELNDLAAPASGVYRVEVSSDGGAGTYDLDVTINAPPQTTPQGAPSGNGGGLADGGEFNTVFGIDSGLNTLVKIGNLTDGIAPNAGQVFTVGPLGVDAPEILGFDVVIDQDDNRFAFLAMRAGRAGTGLFSVDLATGAATLISLIGRRVSPIGLAVQPIAR